MAKRPVFSAQFAGAIKEVAQAVEAGSTFAQALGEHPGLFNEHADDMTRVGEATGSLDDSLMELAGHIQILEPR